MSGRRKREKSPDASSKKKRSRIRSVSSESSSGEENSAGTSASQLSSKQESMASIESALRHDIQHNIRSGKVLKIQLKNFMCHRNMVVEFNKRANLLVGNNGSGKSAVLTALTIGLGCSASQTNRSSSLKQLIKHGETQATIEIHLENDSFDAYERDVYGNKIIVVRTISASGSNTYKLKSEHGSVISTSRTELQKMILYLNIQVDNPVCVLNQDLARSFLKDADEKKQFSLFLKATQIDAITSKLNGCTPQLENAKHNLECSEKSLKFLENEIEKMNDKYNSLQSVEQLKGKLVEARLKLGWRNVSDKAAECFNLETQLGEKLDIMKEHTNAIQNKEVIEAQIDACIQRFRNDIEAKKVVYGEVKEKCAEVRKISVGMQEQHSDKQRELKKYEERQKRFTDDIHSLETDMKQRSETGVDSVAEEKRRNEALLAGCTDKRGDLLAMIENAKRDVDSLHNTLNQINDAKEELNHRRVAKQHEKSRAENQLRQFESSSRDSLAVFGNNMAAFVAKIKTLHERGRFSELPRGPLGQYVQVKDKKWTALVETMLGQGMLQAFYVNSDADRNTLNKLIQSEFPEMRGRTIITSRFHSQVYDTTAGSVREVEGSHSLLNLINVTDPVVMNCLIDQVRIETILAVEDQNLAIELTERQENVPRNLQKVVVMEPRCEFYPMPNYRSYGLPKRPARFLQVNISELKKQTEALLRKLQQELKDLDQKVEQNARTLNEKRAALQDKTRQLGKQQQELHSLDMKIKELKEIEYPAESEDATLQNELQELKTSLAKLQEERMEKTAEAAAFYREMLVQIESLKEKKDHMSKIEQEIEQIQEKIDAEQEKKHDMQANSKTKQQQLDRLQGEVRTLQAARNAAKEAHDAATAEAQKLGDQLEVTETQDQLKKFISATDKRIKHINSSNDDIGDVKAILDNKLMKRDISLRYTESLKKVIRVLQNSRTSRYAYLHKLKSHMSLRVKHKFNTVMQLRGFVGEILMDAKNCTLALSVVPRDKNVSNAVCNTKSLSGGERSYSTVAFLISLWSCVDTPFYFLDEYDVFTDQVNRHMMTVLLLNEANRKADRQFCFLTPQDMSNIQASDELTIHRMADPERC